MSSHIQMIDAQRFGPQENGVTVISAAAAAVYTIDLAQYGPLGEVPLTIYTSTGVLLFKFSNNLNATIVATATSGLDRAHARAAADTPFDVLPPKGYRYLILQSTVIATIRIHARGPFTAPDPMDLLHIYAEGDSNTALDSASNNFAGGARWWYQLQGLFAANGHRAQFVANVAQSGSQWTVGSGLAPNPIISATRQNALDGAANANLINVVLLATSTNDILSLGDTTVTIQGNYRTWMDNRIAAAKNWIMIPVFLPAMQHSRNAGVTALNAWLPDLATVTESNRALAVVAPRPTLLNDSSPTNQDPVTGYYHPNTNISAADHYNANGCGIVAKEIYRTLRAIATSAWPARP